MQPMLNHIDLVVTDVAASVEFYRRLGLDIPDETVWSHDGRPHHVEVKANEGMTLGIDSVELTKSYDAAWNNGPMVIFSVNDRESVDQIYEDLTSAGYVSHMQPMDVFWGARYAIVDDPDGNHIGIMSPSDREHQSAPAF